MNNSCLFAVGTIGQSTRSNRKPSTLLSAAKHNRRVIQAETGARGHIDPQRIALNETIHGPSTPQGVVDLASTLLAASGVDVERLRKDYTQAIELLFSLPIDAAIDHGRFFVRCFEWTADRFGLENILSADIHRDESTPHCHVLVLPLVNGKMRGSALVGRAATAELRDSFYRDVAKPFGLRKPVDRMKGAGKAVAVCAVLHALESNQDAILRSALWVVVKREIERNPAMYVEALGIDLPELPKKTLKPFVDYVTSTGKGAKSERVFAPVATETKPIGFAGADLKPIGFEKDPEKDRNLSCVGFANPTPSLSSKSPSVSSLVPMSDVQESTDQDHTEQEPSDDKPNACDGTNGGSDHQAGAADPFNFFSNLINQPGALTH